MVRDAGARVRPRLFVDDILFQRQEQGGLKPAA